MNRGRGRHNGIGYEPIAWIVSPAWVLRRGRAWSHPTMEWCYLGTDVEQRRRVAAVLPNARRVAVGEEVTALAATVRQPVLDWIAELGRRQSNPLRWWSSMLASRSPLQTDLFATICDAELVHRWRSADGRTAPRLIVVEDGWLGRTLRCQLAGTPGVRFGGHGRLALTARVAQAMVRAGWVRLRAISAAVRLIAQGRARGKGAGLEQRGAHPVTLLYTWIDHHSVTASGTLHDPWTGRLRELLVARGHQVKRLSALEMPPALLQAVQQADAEVVMLPRYLRLRDVLVCGLRWFRVRGVHEAPRCCGRAYAPLLVRSMVEEWQQANFFWYQLLDRAVRRLAYETGARINAVVYPFENQPWEKVFCAAWREAAPDVRLIGYQHSWMPPMLLAYFLGNGEQETMPLPHVIVANSERHLQVLREAGYPRERLVNGGALRHEYLHHAAGEAQPGSSQVPRAEDGRAHVAPPTVLVTFPLLAAPSKSLLESVVRAFREPLVIEGRSPAPVRCLLKAHPRLPLERLSDAVHRLPPWIVCSNEPVSRIVASADLLLYVGPTSSWWEALASGVPVLKYRPDFLDIDVIDPALGAPLRVCSHETLRSSVEALLSKQAAPAAGPRLDPAVVERFFGRVDEACWDRVVAGRIDAAASAPLRAVPELAAGERRPERRCRVAAS